MPDTVPLPAVSGKVATDTRTIDGQEVEVQRVGVIGSTAIHAARAAVTTISAEAVPARATRRVVTLLALETNTADVDVGEAGVAAGAGFPLAPGAAKDLFTTAAIHADTAAGNQVLAYIEEYEL